MDYAVINQVIGWMMAVALVLSMVGMIWLVVAQVHQMLGKWQGDFVRRRRGVRMEKRALAFAGRVYLFAIIVVFLPLVLSLVGVGLPK